MTSKQLYERTLSSSRDIEFLQRATLDVPLVYGMDYTFFRCHDGRIEMAYRLGGEYHRRFFDVESPFASEHTQNLIDAAKEAIVILNMLVVGSKE